LKIAVIGSGFGGLASAIRLQNKGYETIILEKSDKTGGRAYVFENNGFQFDAGPTVITAPWLITELFELCGRKPTDYINLVKLDPFYRLYLDNGKYFNYNGVKKNVIEQISKFNKSDIEGYSDFISVTEKIFNKGFSLIDKPFNKISNLIGIVPSLLSLKAYKSVYKLVSHYIKDEDLRKFFTFHTLLIGGNPFTTTSIYTLIHHLEQKWGVWYCMGGTGTLVKSLTKLYQEIGGKLYTNNEVTDIFINSFAGKPNINALKCKNGNIYDAEVVICNSDVGYTYKYLIENKFRKKFTDKKIDKFKYSMSLFVIYFGTKCRYDNIPHHSIIFGKTYKELLNKIFCSYELSEDFSLYLHRPTATDKTVAPLGCDNFYVLSPVPNQLSKINWKQEGETYKNRIMDFLEDRYLPELRRNLITEFYITPDYFEKNLNSYLGSAFSIEPTLLQSAYMRPHNISEDIENLFLVGAGTHPGAGLPGVISSAKIAEKLIEEKYPLKNQ